jgi:uracil-DNA glycosylase family 4
MAFWTKSETASTTRGDGRTYSCISCQLYKNCDSPKIKADGDFRKKILNIFDFPRTLEDKKGYFMPDPQLKKFFHKKGISIDRDCLNTYALKCAPVDIDEKKLNYQMDCCRLHLMRLIKKHKPKVINVFGIHALYSVIGSRWEGALDGINKWRGFVIPDQNLKCWIAPFYSVSYLADNSHLKALFKTDIDRVLHVIKEEFPVYKPPNITVLKKNLKPLLKIKSGIISFDYETTGLKPHAKGQRIVCASVATNEDDVFAFMMPKKKEDRKPFIKLLKNPNVKKMAHNMKFEQAWSQVRLGTRVNKWHWDSMIAAHILDNRTGVTGLKFQTYVHFGVMDYSSEITPHLKGKKKNANSMNKLLKFVATPKGEEMTLEYCALDSIFEYRLAIIQQKIIDNILPF